MDAGKVCMVGDRCFDIEAACALGLGAIGANYGYALPGELIQSGADIVFDSVEELARYLIGES
jgi:phosphoglycolate phosphatase